MISTPASLDHAGLTYSDLSHDEDINRQRTLFVQVNIILRKINMTVILGCEAHTISYLLFTYVLICSFMFIYVQCHLSIQKSSHTVDVQTFLFDFCFQYFRTFHFVHLRTCGIYLNSQQNSCPMYSDHMFIMLCSMNIIILCPWFDGTSGHEPCPLALL